MARNSQEIERVLRLQKQIFLFSSWLLQKLDAQAHVLSEKERRIMYSLSNGDLAQHDRFIASAASRLRTILHERSEISDAREKVDSEYKRQRMMLRIMEKRLAKMRGGERRAAQDKELDDLLDNEIHRRA